MRFFLIGYQIDPTYFLGILETLETQIKHYADPETIDKQLLMKVINLVQLCMAVHTGHPEKYKSTSELISELTTSMNDITIDNEH